MKPTDTMTAAILGKITKRHIELKIRKESCEAIWAVRGALIGQLSGKLFL